MNHLKIYYTIPFYVPEKDQELYSKYLDYARVAKDQGVAFEMISFQDSPGRFLTDKAVYKIITSIGDQAFPITVSNDEVVKTATLPTIIEFKEWFEELEEISFEDLLKEAKNIEEHTFPNPEEIERINCSSNCSTCNLNICGFSNINGFNDIEF